MIKYLILALATTWIPLQVFGHIHDKSIEGVSSGRDEEGFQELMHDAKTISDIAILLDYPVSNIHKMTFVSSEQLSRLTANGRHALPHWKDGKNILDALKNVNGILEFVTDASGGEVCGQCNRSFYSDIPNRWTQRQVIEHVMGHNFFSAASGYRVHNDSMGISLALAEQIREYEQKIPEGEVSRFIQHLYSLEMLQGLSDGSYDPPASFIPKKLTADQIMLKMHAQRTRGEKFDANQDTKPSLSVLAGLVAHFPEYEPWKKDLIRKFESMNSHYPGNVQTKIINEGWATFSQLLLHKYTPWANQDEATFESAHLLSGVAYPKISNPYWLGLEGWKNFHKKVMQELDKSALTDLEKDKKFVAKAKSLIQRSNSFRFLLEVLDDEWVLKNQIGLYRKASFDEIERSCQGKPQSCWPQQGEEAYIFLSRRATRVVRNIARENADFSFHYPMIEFISANWQGSGSIRLNHRKRATNDFSLPLEMKSTAQTLYIIAMMMQRPVMLDSFALRANEEAKSLSYDDFTIKVEPTGEVSLVSDKLSIEEQKEAIQLAKNAIEAYQLDEYINDINELNNDDLFTRAKILTQTYIQNKLQASHVHRATNSNTLLSHAPTSSEAILAYEKMSQKRLAKILHLAVQGKINIKKGLKSVSLAHLPTIPSIRLDHRYLNFILSLKKPAPVDSPDDLAESSYYWGQDDDAKMGKFSGPFSGIKPGDIFKLPTSQGGSGDSQDNSDSGSEDGEPEDGDPQDSPGGNNPSDIEISIEDWGKLLSQAIELPNLKKTQGGDSKITIRKKAGTVRREHGDLVYPKMVRNILPLALAEKIFQEQDIFSDFDPVAILQKGFELARPADRVVINRKEKPLPAMQAVICIVMDFSGSMQGKPHESAANFVFNFRSLVLAKYDTIKFHYIVYDSQAHEFLEEDVFGKKPKFLGGSTSNVVGYQAALEILNRYDNAQWNKYVIGLGDAGAADGSETAAIIEKTYPQCQFMGFVYTSAGGLAMADQGFLAAMQGLSQKLKWFGYSELQDPSQASTIKTLRELFKEN